MPATATRAPFRYVGVTDERVTCEACGKPNLRSTIVLMPLDADGNDEGDPVYYGSSCGARALGERSGAKVLELARNRHERLRDDVRDALAFLAFVGVDVQGRPMFTRDGGTTRLWGPAARRYGFANPVGRWATEAGSNLERVQDAVDRKVAIVRDAITVGVLTP